MGATTFTTYEPGFDVSEAFARVKAGSRYQHGAGGYTGTLAE